MMVPRAGLEPARHFQTRDFKSLAYTISPPGLAGIQSSFTSFVT